MNGDDKREIMETFRFEFQQAFNPLAQTVRDAVQKTGEQGEDIAANRENIKTLFNMVRTLSGRQWAIIVGVPALIFGIVGLIAYLF